MSIRSSTFRAVTRHIAPINICAVLVASLLSLLLAACGTPALVSPVHAEIGTQAVREPQATSDTPATPAVTVAVTVAPTSMATNLATITSSTGKAAMATSAPTRAATLAPTAAATRAASSATEALVANTMLLKLGTVPASADPAKGKALFNKFQAKAGMACTNCHRADSEERVVGPGLLNVAIRAANNMDGRLSKRGLSTAAEYLRDAIVNPGGYVLPDYPDVMPKIWGKIFNEQQLDDLVAYLLSLRSAN